MEHTIHAQPGYPFTLALQRRVRALGGRPLGAARRRRTSAPTPARTGTGRIPTSRWGRRRSTRSCFGRPVRRVLFHDERDLPVGLRAGRRHGVRLPERRDRSATRSSTTRSRTWSGTRTGARGVPRGSRDREAPSRCGSTSTTRYLMLFTGDPLPDVNRSALAVEPMTCPPNAFRTGDSVIRLAPGESATGVWGIAAH